MAPRTTGPPRPPPTLRPVPDRPLLLVEGSDRMLVLSDVHLGLGFLEPRGPRAEVGSAASLSHELTATARAWAVDRVLVVGDVKDPIRRTPRHVRSEVGEFFGRLLEAGLACEVVLGNHDVGLPSMLPLGVVVHPAGGLLREGVGYFHGHAWPSKMVLLRARTLVSGHLHPGFRLAPSADRASIGKERCWLRTEMRPLTRRDRSGRRRHPVPRATSFLVLPAFNPLCANGALNREVPGRGRRFLVRRFLARGSSRAFLLDGTDLGPVVWPGAAIRGP